MSRLREQCPEAWATELAPTLEGENFAELEAFVASERARHTVFPPHAETFAALDACPPSRVRVVVLGQDPYHGEGQAHGLAFSVRRGQPIPPSLRNIYKERESDLGLPPPPHGELSNWARQGVLLLNTVLTVRQAEANSHKKRGWERFTDAVVGVVANREHPAVFVLWGRPAQAKAKLIPAHHWLVQSAHPSPLSAHRGFFGSRPFSRINERLRAWGDEGIDWRVEGE